MRYAEAGGHGHVGTAVATEAGSSAMTSRPRRCGREGAVSADQAVGAHRAVIEARGRPWRDWGDGCGRPGNEGGERQAMTSEGGTRCLEDGAEGAGGYSRSRKTLARQLLHHSYK